MAFGQGQEAGEGYVSKLFTGVENFKVTHVNPTHEELKQIYGDNAKEPVYVTEEEGVKRIMINLLLDNEPEEGQESIKTRLTFFVANTPRVSDEKGKTEYINAYGQSAWLPSDGTVSEAMSWFDKEGMRPALNGEVPLIQALRNLLNLPSKKNAKNPADAKSEFSMEEWKAMASGNFTALRNVVKSSPNKLGVLLGVKTMDDGKMYQDTFNRSTLRQYGKTSQKFDYLRDSVTDAQANGAYSKTDFGNPDYILREFTPGEVHSDNGGVLAEQEATEFDTF